MVEGGCGVEVGVEVLCVFVDGAGRMGDCERKRWFIYSAGKELGLEIDTGCPHLVGSHADDVETHTPDTTAC